MNTTKVQNISFKRALRESEIADYKKTLQEARASLGADGKNVLIVPDTSLPTSNKSIVGNLSDDKALEFADFMKTYLGINAVEYLPQGDFQENSNHFNPYNSTSLTYPKHLINLENFTKKEFGELLKPEEIKTNDKAKGTGKSRAELDEVYNEYSDFNNTLRTVYSRFDENNPLWQEYQDYKKENDEFITPRVLFSNLARKYNNYEPANWPEPDATLFKNVDENKKKRLEELKTEYKDKIDFYAFEQFFANKNLKYSKEKLNKMGIELVGDCPVRFSRDEMWANPDACRDDLYIGKSSWGIQALDYQNLFDKNGEPMPSMQLLGKKFSKMLKDYDSIRVDCGWCYIQPSLWNNRTQEKEYINDNKNLLDDKIVKYFEKLAKEIKGKNYDLKKIMYETEVGGEDFFGFNKGRDGVFEPLKDRVQIYTTVYADNNWGTLENYKKRGIDDDELLIGTGNHDFAPINNFMKGDQPLSDSEIEDLNKQYESFFNYRTKLETKEDLVKAKRAEIALAKNQMHLFYDVFGWKLDDNQKYHPVDSYYSTKINEDFKEEYINSLKAGTGYNPMESLQLAFLKEGKNVSDKKLYDKISKYSAILKAEEGELIDDNDKKKNKVKYIIGGIAAGVLAIGAFIFAKFKKKPEKKENV